MTQTGARLRVQDLTLRFGGVAAVDGFSFDVEAGELIGLIGPNGAGKSSVFNCLSGAYMPTSGRIELDGTEITRMRSHGRAGMGLARTFQNLAVYPDLSVMENLLLGGQVGLNRSLLRAGLRGPRLRRQERELRERAEAVAGSLGLGPYLEGAVGEMPYGVQKRLDVGRILLRRPRLLLLDEPLVGMTQAEKTELVALIQRAHAELGTTTIVVEHDVSIVMEVTSRILVMNFGRLLAQGTAAEIQSDPQVIEAYLGSGSRAAAIPDPEPRRS